LLLFLELHNTNHHDGAIRDKIRAETVCRMHQS